MIGVGAAALATCTCLALLVENSVPAFPPGTMVVSDHLAVACPTEDVEKAMSLQGRPDSAAFIARMAQANCKAIAPDTRFLVVTLMESGVMLVRPASGSGKPLAVLSRDFSAMRRPE